MFFFFPESQTRISTKFKKKQRNTFFSNCISIFVLFVLKIIYFINFYFTFLIVFSWFLLYFFHCIFLNFISLSLFYFLRNKIKYSKIKNIFNKENFGLINFMLFITHNCIYLLFTFTTYFNFYFTFFILFS